MCWSAFSRAARVAAASPRAGCVRALDASSLAQALCTRLAMMSPLEIVCGTSLGPFVLGSRLHEVLAIVRREAYRDVTLSWDEQVRRTLAHAL